MVRLNLDVQVAVVALRGVGNGPEKNQLCAVVADDNRVADQFNVGDPKPQKQKVKLKRKPKEKHLCALQHPKATKVPANAKAKKEQESREGEYMAGESDNVPELTTRDSRAFYRIAGDSSASGTAPVYVRTATDSMDVTLHKTRR